VCEYSCVLLRTRQPHVESRSRSHGKVVTHRLRILDVNSYLSTYLMRVLVSFVVPVCDMSGYFPVPLVKTLAVCNNIQYVEEGQTLRCSSAKASRSCSSSENPHNGISASAYICNWKMHN
jgi:hypothetical protein